jgi:hypothetical protein
VDWRVGVPARMANERASASEQEGNYANFKFSKESRSMVLAPPIAGRPHASHGRGYGPGVVRGKVKGK